MPCSPSSSFSAVKPSTTASCQGFGGVQYAKGARDPTRLDSKATPTHLATGVCRDPIGQLNLSTIHYNSLIRLQAVIRAFLVRINSSKMPGLPLIIWHAKKMMQLKINLVLHARPDNWVSRADRRHDETTKGRPYRGTCLPNIGELLPDPKLRVVEYKQHRCAINQELGSHYGLPLLAKDTPALDHHHLFQQCLRNEQDLLLSRFIQLSQSLQHLPRPPFLLNEKSKSQLVISIVAPGHCMVSAELWHGAACIANFAEVSQNRFVPHNMTSDVSQDRAKIYGVAATHTRFHDCSLDQHPTTRTKFAELIQKATEDAEADLQSQVSESMCIFTNVNHNIVIANHSPMTLGACVLYQSRKSQLKAPFGYSYTIQRNRLEHHTMIL